MGDVPPPTCIIRLLADTACWAHSWASLSLDVKSRRPGGCRGLVGWAGGLVGCSSSLGLGAGQGWAKVRLGQDPVFGAVLSPPNIPTFTAAYP